MRIAPSKIGLPGRTIDRVISRIRIPIILLALTAFAIGANATPPLVTTLGRAFGTPFERFGFAFFAQYLAFAIASTLIAIGGKGRFGVGLLAASLGATSLLFLTVPVLTDFRILLIWFIPVGLAGGFTETHATIVLGRADGDSSRLVSLSQAFFCGGAIIAPQIVSAMLSNGVAWQKSFFLFAGLIGFVAALLSIVAWWDKQVDPRVPRSATSETASGNAVSNDVDYGDADSGNADSERTTAHGPQKPGTRDALKMPVLIAFTFAMFFYVVGEGAIVAWIATFFEVRFSLQPEMAAQTLSAFWFGVFLGRLIVTFVPKRFGLWPALLLSTLAGTTALIVTVAAGSLEAKLASVVVAGILLGPVWPVLVSTGRILLRSERAVAIIVTGGAIGVAVGPFAASRFMVVFGIGRLFVFVLACSFLVTSIVYTVWVMAKK